MCCLFCYRWLVLSIDTIELATEKIYVLCQKKNMHRTPDTRCLRAPLINGFHWSDQVTPLRIQNLWLHKVNEGMADFTPVLQPPEEVEREQDLKTLKRKLFMDADISDEPDESETTEPELETPGRKKSVLIYLRVRPKRPVEITNCDPDCLHQTSDFELLAIPPNTSKTYKNSRIETSHKFSFSHIFNPATTQKELFDETLRPLLKDFFGGQNCLVFTYGVTNSGTWVGRGFA